MKNMKSPGLQLILFVTVLCLSVTAFGRALYDDVQLNPGKIGKISAEPYVTIGVHRVGKIGLTITNLGQIGTGFTGDLTDPRDPSRIAPSCTYPYPGGSNYLFAGSFWIGAVVGRDTLVSVGADGWFQTQEMWPDPYPEGEIIFRSISNAEDIDAISEEDFIAVYTDTVTSTNYVTQDQRDGRPHMPLNIEITQRSYAWSYSYAEDFVLFDYSIKNIGRNILNKFYMGLYVDGDVGTIGADIEEATDDICGFRRAIESPFGCGWIDTINIAWISDNNGRNDSDSEDNCPWGSDAYTAITGMRVVRTPSDSLKYSFNWWISNGYAPDDFGPRKAGTPEDPFRDFGGFLGTPEGDRNKYYIMRHEEFDYDQLFSAKDNTAGGWMERSSDADDYADGYDTRYLLSFGPFDISPGEVLPLTFAYIAGEDFLTDCEAYEEFNASIPEEYYNTFNFEKVGLNAIWAGQIYDNPGVDTDDDGYAGKYRVCVESTDVSGVWEYEYDTVYYLGDGVPDFKGASPPPAPELWVIDPYPTGDTLRSLIVPHVNEYNEGEVTIRWYGFKSETTEDPFSGVIDFEGYRVWIGLSDELSQFSQICSFDKEDYNRYEYNPLASSEENRWELNELPFTIDELKEYYDDEDFDPTLYTRDNPLLWKGESFYFSPQDWNRSEFTDTTIHKVYPLVEPPTIPNHDSARIYYPEELTEDGYFKYYMYEFKLNNLLPSQKYFFAVTAFDFGSPASNLEALETRPNKNYVAEYPQNQNTVVEDRGLNVIVYPNPYRIDGGYFDNGFEGRENSELAEDRRRRIHFTNLPNKCTIRIFSIDGDLIREIVHDEREDSPQSMHEEWDLITRNTQAVVSGIYYYSVNSEYGNQVGKIVIIM